MAGKERLGHAREGVIKYTKPPTNKVPPSQRPVTSQKSTNR